MSELIDPVEVQIKDSNGTEKLFILGKMPATIGREVLAKYPLSSIPKVGDYDTGHAAMLKMMRFVETEGGIRLTTAALIDNHVPDGEALLRLEIEMLRHNTSFFGRAGSQTLGAFLLARVQEFAPSIMQTLMGFFAAIISAGFATLTELKTTVTLEEAFDLWEIAVTNRYNEAAAAAAANRKLR